MRPQADVSLLLAVNASGPASLEPLMQALSWLGDYWRIPLYAAVSLVIALVCRRNGNQQAATSWLLAALGTALALPLSASLTAWLKEAIAAPRPAALLGIGAVRVLAETHSEFSFPSGHSASAALLAASLWPVVPAWARAALIVLAFLVGASRIWLGIHFPSDVVAGLFIGAAMAMGTRLLVRRVFALQRP